MRNKPLSRLAGAAFSFAASGLAFAADMPEKASPPAPAPAPVYNWTGWYVGVNAGTSFGNVKTDFNVAPVTIASLTPPLLSQTGPALAFSDREYPDGFIGGGQIGYNWQYSPLIVLGVEADFQGTLERDSATLSNSFFSAAPFIDITTGLPTGQVGTFAGTVATNYTTKIDWFGTVRLRAGTEGKLLIPGWTLKAEYLYMDLGTLDTTGVTSGVSTEPDHSVTGGRSPRTPISPTTFFASG